MLPVVALSRPILRPGVDVLTKTSTRCNSYSRVVSGPPHVRISFPEKVAHGIAIFVGCSFVPWLITSNIPKYRQQESEEE